MCRDANRRASRANCGDANAFVDHKVTFALAARKGENDHGGTKQAGYQDKVFDIGSPEHLALIKRAIRAKVDQNPEVGEAFAATHPRPIIHDTGHPDKPNAVFPATVFTRLLTEVRQELRAVQE